MPEQFAVDRYPVSYPWLNRAIARICTFLMAGIASFTMALNTYLDDFRATHLGVILVVLLSIHLVWHSRFTWRREFMIYAYLVGYMFVALLWTRDVDLAMNTLVPAANFIFVMILFGSMISFHHVPSVLKGALCGFMLSAAVFTLTQGFPFSYPQDFSYNSIAGMYLFGLFITLMYSCFTRSHAILLGIAVVIMLHIVATTSIKTNLGIALGLVAAGIMYFRHFGRLLRRRLLLLIVLAGGLGFAVSSNDALLERLGHGVERVTIGVKVLQTRDDVAGYSAFAERDYWRQAGIDGWKQNPVFGYGTEAFRYDYGITSHSTPIDLLYNYGLIGLILFYGVFASLSWRLIQPAGKRVSNQRALMFGGVICYLFMTLSGTLLYNSFLGAFVGIAAALLTSQGAGIVAPPAASGNRKVERR
jgi:O-antigen ligase